MFRFLCHYLQGAVAILHRGADPAELPRLQQEYEDTLCTPFQAAARGICIYFNMILMLCMYGFLSSGFVDDVILPRETRKRICEDLELLTTKKQSLPWKKHSNIPL